MGLYVCESCLKNYGLRDSGAHSCVCPCDVCLLQNKPSPVWCRFTQDLHSPTKCGVSIEEQVKGFRVVRAKISHRLENAHLALKLLGLRARDLDATKDFYALLGVEFQMDQHGQGPKHYAGMIDGLVLQLYQADEEFQEDHQMRLGLEVSGLEEILSLVTPVRGTIVKALYDTSYGCKAVVRDPDGRILELYEKTAVPA